MDAVITERFKLEAHKYHISNDDDVKFLQLINSVYKLGPSVFLYRKRVYLREMYT